MKSVQKFILPALIIIAAIAIYSIYFTPKKGLGSFADFDPNNNANKDIRVKIVETRGIRQDASGSTIFYAVDRHGTEVLVQGPPNISPDVRTAETVVLRGHLHKEYFHAADVVAD
jgi:cytochrome c-type biogenesis protein CcmE